MASDGRSVATTPFIVTVRFRNKAKYSVPRADVEYSHHLFEEFEVFSVQIKSTLDHLVSALRPMIRPKWTICTFGAKGETVLNSLKRNTGRKHEGRVRMMEHLLFREQHKEWLGWPWTAKIVPIEYR